MQEIRRLTLFGLAVKRALLEKQMTQKQFCEKEGIPVNRFTEILYGLRPGKRYRNKIAEALGIDRIYNG
ncbi:hypothetical protein ACFOQM_15695 [Paenibacillus sp. GCM10012307]|uniref:Helix-turn-helix transcriptional regulator n=1 Tax=Paenibacillus roseus TaxID=2798579 RepID=A0A934J6L5_9BACL|nr:helix-turn-helix transcriptional regulator [Paenibacillus roseus]MBJ6362689.1 helix-turn-helix transcriptional regulator [Paenibacillus roseus]